MAVFCGGAGVLAAAAGQVPEATTYQIRNVKYGDLLRPKDANSATGTPIVLYSAQPWKCMTWRLQPAGADGFHLRNLFTSKTFCASTNSPRQFVTQIPLAKDGADAPVWQFTKLDDGRYKITDRQTNKVLTATKVAGEYGARIVISEWQNSDEQKWTLEKIDPKQLTM